MDGERDPKFYCDLKQINEDLYKYLTECREKSLYNDYSPTFYDYIKQVEELLKQYPQTKTKDLFSTKTINITPPPPTSTPFSFGTSLFPTPPNKPLFSFSLPKKEEELQTANNTNSLIFGTPFSHTNTNTSTNKDNNTADNDGDDHDEKPPEPKVDRYEEKDYKYSVKAKLYERGKSVGGEVRLNLLGIGYLYVKNLDSESKLHVIFRKEPDLWTVLLNEVVTQSIPIGKLPKKAVHMVFPSETGDPRSYIVKAKDEKDAEDLYNTLNSLKE